LGEAQTKVCFFGTNVTDKVRIKTNTLLPPLSKVWAKPKPRQQSYPEQTLFVQFPLYPEQTLFVQFPLYPEQTLFVQFTTYLSFQKQSF